MRTLTIAAALLGTTLMSAPAALAIPIAPGSEFNVHGNATFNSTTITFTNPASSSGNSGSFAGFSCPACVTITSPLTFDPFTAGLVYTATTGGVTTTFTITSNLEVLFSSDKKAITIIDEGTATLTGYDPTPGTWTFGANKGVVTGSFSATTEVTPRPIAEPATIGLLALGAALIGVATVRRGRAEAA